MPADIRAYLEIRTASAVNFNPSGEKLLVSSNLTGHSQIYRLDRDRGDGQLVQLTDTEEPVGGAYLPHRDGLLVAMDTGGNERHQLYLRDDEPGSPLHDLVVDPEHIHRAGGMTRDGRLLAYATNRGNGVDFDVWVRDLGTGAEECVHAPGTWASPAGFSPDGQWLAVSEMTETAGDNRMQLLHLPSGSLHELAPHDEAGLVGSPSWLPDSSALLFSTDVGRDVSGIARAEPGAEPGAEVGTEAGTDRWEYVLEGEWDTGCSIDWTGRHLLTAANVDGYTEAVLRDPATLQVTAEVPLPGRGVAGGFSFSKDGRYLAYTYTSPLVPGDAWCYDTETGALERLTVSPCDVDQASFVEPELVRFPSFDGLEIPAYVFRPRAGGGPRPVVVMIHGGPESQYRPTFSPLTQYLVAQGFAVVAPNVRGSTGYGKRYQSLDDGRLRMDSVADLAALHDWLAATDDLDADRAALYGGSYGGYMVLCGLAFQPERWAAGVDVVGMSSLVTFLENTSDYRRRFREREYGRLDTDRDFLVAASPITHVEQMRAPLLIIHGANDPRVPLSEAEAIHDVLEAKGVRSELLVYHDEGHGLAKLPNRIDAYPKVAAFLHDVLDA
jgi:dipeptidyl aminopeptidase/acylaminoacyl peptidase